MHQLYGGGEGVRSMVEVRDMMRRDWVQVRQILGESLATGIAAFRKTPPKWPDWDGGHLALGRTVAVDPAGAVIGLAALTPVPDT